MGAVLRRSLAWLPVAAVVVAAVLLAGWGARTPREEPPPPAPVRLPFADPTSLSGVEARSLVRDIRLAPRDLATDFERVPAHTRAALHQQPGADLCGAAYPSDAFRLAMGVDLFRADDGRRVRTRVIAYGQGGAEQAVDELREAAPACSRAVRPSDVQQPGTLALRVRSTGRPHELVVERRGDVVVLLETDRLDPAVTLDLARRLSVRLLSLQPDG